MKSDLLRGARHGFPIALGYLSVSFGFGILAVREGLVLWEAVLISAACVTSAGQVAGVTLLAAGGSLWELALVQLTVNLRYALMSLSLSQKLDDRFTMPRRLAAAFGITDEIFAVCAAQPGRIAPAYMAGMIAVSVAGWVGGTALGGMAGALLPTRVTDALGILLYGMFVAIVVPPARHRPGVRLAALAAAGASLLLTFAVPVLSGSLSVIIAAVAAAALAAVLFPLPEEKGDDA